QAAGLAVGDRLRYSAPGRSLEGRLMPRPENGDRGCLVLKLDSGYNIGLGMAGAKIEKVSSAPPADAPARPASDKDEKESGYSAHQRAPILFLSTGGTIASRVDYRTGAVHPQTDAASMVAAFPRLASLSPIRNRSLFSILSEDITPGHWTQMANAAVDAFKDGAEGVVISHGTDTMGYSAAALSFALDGLPGPVIFVGAQRSPDRPSTDAAQNLYCSAAAARSPLAAVAVCMHASTSDGLNRLHWGTRVRKSHTTGRWTFRSMGVPPLGRVMADSGQVFIDDPAAPRRDKSRTPSARAGFSSNVHLAWVYPGLTPKTVEKWADYDGVVLASTGLHGVPVDANRPDSKTSVLPALRELSESGVLLALAPQAMGGRVNMEIYSTGRLLQEVGVLGHLCDWLPETAYAKMCWALGQTSDKKKAAELLLQPRARDITERSLIDESETSP
ncbi:MAG: Glu-tRNA(Gln) amidotransferase subunit GatD, partial [Candidatus Micrarchaeota archaeon]|nr:Glu-tRNA(Gln) amidotransferase subunit GatD [Candidatus Micrarchaeota archaeon]